MHISARVEYAMKALMELTAAYADDPGRLVKSESIAREQEIPSKFLENILRGLKQAGIVVSQRGAEGGFRLAKPPAEVSVADVIRAQGGDAIVTDPGLPSGEPQPEQHDRLQAADVRLVSGREDDRVLGAHPVGQLGLQFDVERGGPVQEPRARDPRAVLLERLGGGPLDPRVPGQSEVVVRPEHDRLPPFHLDHWASL